MKSVLISIRPKWVEKIASGKKTIEVRKSAPKEVPFKAYIYCTKDKPYLYRVDDDNNFELTNTLRPKTYEYVKDYNEQNGKVIGEFICDKVATYPRNYEFGYEISENEFNETALTAEQFVDYGKGKTLYGWHISDLKIYDKPKELSEFRPICKFEGKDLICNLCPNHEYNGGLFFECRRKVNRPPQSYMRVKELKEV